MRQLWMSLQKFHVKSGLSTPLFARPRRRGCRSEPRLKIGGNLPQKADANPSKLRRAQQASSCIAFKVYFLLCAFAYGMAIGLEFPSPLLPCIFVLFSSRFPFPTFLVCFFVDSMNRRAREGEIEKSWPTSDKQSAPRGGSYSTTRKLAFIQ